MSEPVAKFWKRLQASQLLTASRLEAIRAECERLSEGTIDVKALVKHLLGKGVLNKFQVKALLASQRSPLVYGEYVVLDEAPASPLRDRPGAELVHLRHVPTGHEVDGIVLRRDRLPPSADPERSPDLKPRVAKARAVRQGQILRAYDVLVGAGGSDNLVIVVDAVRGETLARRLARGSMSASEASSVTYQLAQGLAAWHEAGLFHGDLRPENVTIDEAGTVRLWRDPAYLPIPLFGADAAALAELEQRAPYLAPELDVQQAAYGPLTDLYALGCLYYNMLAGKPPFQRDSLVATMRAHASERIEPLEPLGVPAPIEKIITYLMAKRPDLRYQNASVVADQISRFAESDWRIAPPPPPSETQGAFDQWLERRDAALLTGTPMPSFAPPFATAAAGGTPAVAGLVGAASTPTPIVSHNSPQRLLEARLAAKQRRKRTQAIGAVVLLLGAIIAAAMVFWPPGKPSDTVATPEGNPSGDGKSIVNPEVVSSTVSSAAIPQQVVPDDGKLLWESPTQGEPLTLLGLPDAPKSLLVVRPNALFAGESGGLLLRALGPKFELIRQNFEADTGMAIDQIKTLMISWHEDSVPGAAWRSVQRVELAEPVELDVLAQRWKGAGAEEAGDRFFLNGDIALAPLGAESKIDRFLRGPRELVEAVLSRGTEEPTLAPDLKLLLASTDADRHFNLLLSIANLQTEEGRSWSRGFWDPLRETLEPILSVGVRAGTLSAHYDDAWYLEWNAIPALTTNPETLVAQWSTSSSTWQDQLESGIASLPSHPYWERVRLRYPRWIGDALGNLRIGSEDRAFRANIWLPAPAGPNLVTGTELLLSSLTDDVTSVASSTEPMTPSTGETPQDLETLLAATFDFSVSSDDMINVMAQLQTSVTGRYPDLPFPFAIKLMGNDLREEGITQNQRISNFSMTDKPLSEILTGLVVTANPDKASTSPADEKQKLLWLVAPDPADESRQIIRITTRKAAVRGSLSLPEPFRGTAP